MSERKISFCKKRKRGYTFVTRALAIAEAKRLHDEQGFKFYIYACENCPKGFIHFTEEKPGGRWAQNLNKKLINYYAEKERFGKGLNLSKKAWQKRNRARKKAARFTPLYVWENEGGALHPRDLED